MLVMCFICLLPAERKFCLVLALEGLFLGAAHKIPISLRDSPIASPNLLKAPPFNPSAMGLIAGKNDNGAMKPPDFKTIDIA